jgi:diguanylate cyclase (GGDEF)-like protein
MPVMRLVTITNWAYGATVALALAAGGTMLMASGAQEREREAVAQRYVLDRAVSRVGMEAAMLSGLARQYAITGSPEDLSAYERELNRLTADEGQLKRTPDIGAGPEELTALKDGLALVDALKDEQRAAIAARQGGDREGAIALVFSPRYEAELDRAEVLFEKFEYLLDSRVAADVAAAEGVARIWRTLSEIVLGVTAFLFLCVLYFVFRKRVLQPVVKLSDVVTRLAAQDYAAVPPQFDQIDEIGDMAQAIRIFRENGLERQRLEKEKSADRDLRDLLSRMTQRMQASDTLEDLTLVVSRFTPQIARGYAGRLYLLNEKRQAMVQACAWSEPSHSETEFSTLACWALRRGLPHRPSGDCIDIPCAHLGADRTAGLDTICLPLTAQRETLGLLYLEPLPGETEIAAASEVYLAMLAENIGLAIANLRLREALQEMALADPLTGLANRRRLETVLDRELAQAEERGRPLSCIMIDVDHFKQFNDEFGHEAGDAVLQAVGTVLKRSVRDDGLAFRYGGEEFLVLLPGVDLHQGEARAEEIRERVKGLKVVHGGAELGSVTASLGVASTPEARSEQLVQAADGALLQSKRAGRDRVTLASGRGARRRA